MVDYSAIKSNEALIHAKTWMNLEHNTLNEKEPRHKKPHTA